MLLFWFLVGFSSVAHGAILAADGTYKASYSPANAWSAEKCVMAKKRCEEICCGGPDFSGSGNGPKVNVCTSTGVSCACDPGDANWRGAKNQAGNYYDNTGWPAFNGMCKDMGFMPNLNPPTVSVCQKCGNAVNPEPCRNAADAQAAADSPTTCAKLKEKYASSGGGDDPPSDTTTPSDTTLASGPCLKYDFQCSGCQSTRTCTGDVLSGVVKQMNNGGYFTADMQFKNNGEAGCKDLSQHAGIKVTYSSTTAKLRIQIRACTCHSGGNWMYVDLPATATTKKVSVTWAEFQGETGPNSACGQWPADSTENREKTLKSAWSFTFVHLANTAFSLKNVAYCPKEGCPSECGSVPASKVYKAGMSALSECMNCESECFKDVVVQVIGKTCGPVQLANQEYEAGKSASSPCTNCDSECFKISTKIKTKNLDCGSNGVYVDSDNIVVNDAGELESGECFCSAGYMGRTCKVKAIDGAPHTTVAGVVVVAVLALQ